MKRIVFVVLSLLAFAPASARAQATAEDSAVAVANRMLEGMRLGDSAIVRSVFAPGARLNTVAVRREDGATELRRDTLETFLRAVGAPHEFVWDERVDAVHVRVDGPLAVVTMDYSFFAGERFSHCGIDAFQLLRTAEGWKIFQLTDTRRRTGCRAAPAGSP